MDISAISAVSVASSAQAQGTQGSVATTVLKQSLDLQQQVMTQLLNGMTAAGTGTVASPPSVGAIVDVTA
jgi:hypothetical protein